MVRTFEIEWIDHGREPQCAPDPDYPAGKDIDASMGATPSCLVNLPYPAKRCGVYLVRCPVCGFSAGLTTAGRSDDPRSITLPCKVAGTMQ